RRARKSNPVHVPKKFTTVENDDNAYVTINILRLVGEDEAATKFSRCGMHELAELMALCFSMLLGSYFSGIVPLTFKFFKSGSLLTPLANGIMIGTGMSIIIPEGINSIYYKPHQLLTTSSPHHLLNQASSRPASDQNDRYDSSSVTESNQLNNYSNAQDTDNKTYSAIVGLSLVCGFVLMLLIDQLSTALGSQSDFTNANSKDERSLLDQDSISTEQGQAAHHVNFNDGFSDSYSNKREHNQRRIVSQQKVTPTLGLVIHASADGIALGAAATMNHRQVELIIFLAIMLHKAPAAFSLVVILMHRNLKHSVIKTHLMAFSLSAPLAAFLTYFCLSQSGKEALQRNSVTGAVMLFSAGTFLYVATVHVLPDLVHERKLSRAEIVCFLIGSFLPSILTQII
ncbi:Zinc transporter ZIP9, partial [Fragariocoptes setiger]